MSEPINVDRNVTASYFKKNVGEQDVLLITSIFYTIQGEGPYAGHPAVFVRLAGCNYGGKGVTGPGCRFCDTYFAVENAKYMAFRVIYQKIRDLYPHKDHTAKLVVVTGGEPMMQDNLSEFLYRAPSDLHFQIESNGTRLVKIPVTRTSLVVSPKVPEGGKIAHPRYAELPKQVFDRADCLKFVYTADFDSPYHHIPDYAYRFLNSGRRVYISPMAVYRSAPSDVATVWNPEEVDQEATKRNYAAAAELVMEKGFLLSLQTHLFISQP